MDRVNSCTNLSRLAAAKKFVDPNAKSGSLATCPVDALILEISPIKSAIGEQLLHDWLKLFSRRAEIANCLRGVTPHEVAVRFQRPSKGVQNNRLIDEIGMN